MSMFGTSCILPVICRINCGFICTLLILCNSVHTSFRVMLIAFPGLIYQIQFQCSRCRARVFCSLKNVRCNQPDACLRITRWLPVVTLHPYDAYINHKLPGTPSLKTTAYVIIFAPDIRPSPGPRLFRSLADTEALHTPSPNANIRHDAYHLE